MKVNGWSTEIQTSASVPERRLAPTLPRASIAKPVTQDAGNKSANSKPALNPSPWRDEFTEITDRPDGLRTLRCPHATFYTHKTEHFTGVVMPEDDGWWCCARTEEDQGQASLREEAEQCLLECFSINGSGTR